MAKTSSATRFMASLLFGFGGLAGTYVEAANPRMHPEIPAVGKAGIVETSTDDGAGPAGTWLAEDLRGGGVIDRLRTVLEIRTDGQIAGSGGCNAIGGSAEIDGDTIRFAQLVSTQKMCVPAAMDQERKFFDVLGAARGWRIDAPQRKLMLLDADGAQIAVFSQD